jgi:hypothetical protein
VGIGEDEGNGVSSVAFPDDDILTCFWEWELEATRVKFSGEHFRTGESIKVRVNSGETAWSPPSARQSGGAPHSATNGTASGSGRRERAPSRASSRSRPKGTAVLVW